MHGSPGLGGFPGSGSSPDYDGSSNSGGSPSLLMAVTRQLSIARMKGLLSLFLAGPIANLSNKESIKINVGKNIR